MVPRTILSRSGPISVNTLRLVNTVQPKIAVNNAGPMKNVIKNAYLTARRPFNNITSANNSNFTKKVNIVKGTRVNTAIPKAVLSTIKGNKGNDVKASTYFKLTDESHVLLKVPRKDNMCSVDLKNVIPQGGLTCLFTKATLDESNLWHRRLGHVNFKTMNKLGIKREFSVARTPQQNKVAVPGKDYILLPMWPADPLFSQNSKSSHDAGFKPSGEDEKKVTEEPGKEGGDSSNDQEKDYNVNNINNINTASDENSTNNFTTCLQLHNFKTSSQL
ncbi:copia protein [Tanacetum coccineum]|uniref:Copia protein n=1 Tax=Tanacetum coccineum TaxID=301880 RepID=A0ABQ5CGV0_9ASTR